MNDLRSQLKWYSCEGTHIGVYPCSFNESKMWKSCGDSCLIVYNPKNMEEIKHCSIYTRAVASGVARIQRSACISRAE